MDPLYEFKSIGDVDVDVQMMDLGSRRVSET